jgi:hypothetical protein
MFVLLLYTKREEVKELDKEQGNGEREQMARETEREQGNERMRETENMLLEGNRPRPRGSLIRGIR